MGVTNGEKRKDAEKIEPTGDPGRFLCVELTNLQPAGGHLVGSSNSGAVPVIVGPIPLRLPMTDPKSGGAASLQPSSEINPAINPVISPATYTAAETSATVASFPTFYEKHYPQMVRALSLALGSTDLGTEAADEAMTRAYAKWNSVSGYANPSGWTYRVGLNWARSYRRRAARSLPWVGGRDAAVTMPATADPDLRDAIAKLDPKYRDVVVCRYFLDWSTDQTAEALDIRPGTVKSRLSTGMTQLRSALGEL